jgi:hypothetical protein
MKRHVLFGLALLLALALWPAALAAAEPQAGTVVPETGTPGTRFVFLADGFKPNERLSAWANTPDARVVPYDADVPARATSDGSVSWNWAAPAGFQPGTWQFVVHGLSSGVERVFNVGINPPAGAAPAAEYNIQPSTGYPGDIFRFYATGFTEGEQVETRVVAPNGASLTKGLDVDGVARAGGRVDGSWTAVTDDVQYGRWQIVLRGSDSKVERAIPFTLAQPGAPSVQAPRVSPEVGRPGMRFIFELAGFQPDEQLSAWVNTADGRIVAVDQDELKPTGVDVSANWTWTAADDGSVTFGWSAPADAAPGGWSMVVHGRKSGVEQVVAFQIIR